MKSVTPLLALGVLAGWLCAGSSAAAERRFEILPSSVSIYAGERLSFTAVLTQGGSARTPEGIAWTAAGGAIDEQGRFEAGERAGSFAVRARFGPEESSATVIVLGASPREAPPALELPEQPEHPAFEIERWRVRPGAVLGGISIRVRCRDPQARRLRPFAVWADGRREELPNNLCRAGQRAVIHQGPPDQKVRWIELELLGPRNELLGAVRRAVGS